MTMIRGVTALAIAVCIAVGVARAEVTQPPDEALKSAVGTLWQNQHKALDAHDLDGVMGTFADSDDIMLMGTGPGEQWVGKEEVKDAYAHFMQNFDANTMEVQCGDGAGSRRDGVVWLTAVCQFSDKQKDQTRRFVLNISAVVVKQGDDWRFHTMHFSHLTGGGEAQQQTASK